MTFGSGPYLSVILFPSLETFVRYHVQCIFLQVRLHHIKMQEKLFFKRVQTAVAAANNRFLMDRLPVWQKKSFD